MTPPGTGTAGAPTAEVQSSAVVGAGGPTTTTGDDPVGTGAGPGVRRGDVDAVTRAPAAPGFRHDALVYDDVAGLIAVAAPFLLDGLAAGDVAVIAVGADTVGPLCEAVGDHPRLLVLERHTLYRARTPTVITTFRRLAAEHAASGRRVRVVGELDFGVTLADWREWQRYEAVINAAFAPLPLWGLCVCSARLPAEILAGVGATHPQMYRAGERRANPGYVEPATYLRALPVPDEPLEATAPTLDAARITDFIGLRHALRDHLARIDGPPDLLEDFLLAVDEMTSNAVRHGSPPAGLRLWAAPGTLVCTITDAGSGWDDPFAGYGPAHGEDLSRGGMGLWLARQLCDHVAIRSGEHGSSVRLSTRWT